MYKTLNKFLNNCDNVTDVVNYDFKNELSEIANAKEKTSINKFLLYKSFGGKFDCDNSNGSCPLTNDIYIKLWGWDYKQRYTLTGLLQEKFGNVWNRFGSDTINSFQTTYNKAIKIYNNDLNAVRKNKLLNEYAKLTHSIGNFTLVPFHLKENDTLSFNQFRGTKLGDYFDLSLKFLKENVEFSVFKKFIDTFYLNDYVDEHYNIIPLFSRHKQLLHQDKMNFANIEEILPQNEEELNEYLCNVISVIKNRGTKIAKILLAAKGDCDNNMNTEQIKNSILKSKIIRIFSVLLCAFIVSFFIFFFVLSSSACNNAGGFNVLVKQYGFFPLIFELIKLSLIDSLKISLMNVALLTFLYFIIRNLYRKIAKKFLLQCPNCKKIFALKKIKSELAKKEDISILVELKDKDAYGKITGTREEYIPGERKFYNDIYICKHCNKTITKRRTKEVEKI